MSGVLPVIERIYHININCADLEASRAFYEKFGFSTIVEFDEIDDETVRGLGLPASTQGRGALLGRGEDPSRSRETRIDLLEWNNGGSAPSSTADATRLGIPRVALYTKALDDEVRRLQAAGLDLVATPAEFKGTGDAALRSRFACFKDPDGLLVELIEFTRVPS